MRKKTKIIFYLLISLFFIFAISFLLLLNNFKNKKIGEIGEKKREEGVIEMEYNGGKREFMIDLPSDYNRDKKYPVLLGFHGTGGSYDDLSSLFEKTVEQEKVIGVYPQSVGKAWNLDSGQNFNDVFFVSKLMKYITENYSVDKRRVYATGKSAGGYLCHMLAIKFSDKITAIVPMSASLSKDLKLKSVEPVSVMQIHGKKDSIVPYKGGPIFEGRNIDFLSAKESALIWAKISGCDLIPEKENKNNYEEFYFPSCKKGIEIKLITVPEAGHSIPSQIGDVFKADFIWNFLRDKVKNP